MEITNAVWLAIVAIVFFVIFIVSMVVRNRVAKKEKPHKDDLHERNPSGDLRDRNLP
jgi:uncharacterized membrane protein